MHVINWMQRAWNLSNPVMHDFKILPTITEIVFPVFQKDFKKYLLYDHH